MNCPTCRKRDITKEHCPRCGTSLEPLYRIVHLCTKLIEKGKYYLKKQMFKEALKTFTTAYKLYKLEDAKKGIVLSLLGLKRYKRALVAANRIPFSH